ncbi:hypothetical protein ASE74_08260 [Pedobacter sp. Leaf216]|uniref:hypothetical protein n=1 Tax=Pedobacter sp. Leaf216 TaxID=1735684 RepID=UPI0006FE3C40|nr:hypothetical protein [Pedobacter sp. Leaf216]KQM66388.1 hypothetical protein ASE74_08260 [Pedobacter sp. Leaf216]
MQVTLEIKDDNAFSILETLKNIKGIKIKNIEQSNDEYLNDLANAYKETELAEQGKIKLKRFEDLINEI